MKFSLSKRAVDFGKRNARKENEGKEKKHVASDMSVSFMGTKRDIDWLIPSMGDLKASDAFYYDKRLQFPSIQPTIVSLREPEGLKITIYDDKTKPKNAMYFENGHAKSFKAVLKDKHKVEISFTLQFRHDTKFSARLDNLMNTEDIEIEIESAQDEFDYGSDEEAADTEDQPGLDLGDDEPEEEEEEDEDD